MSMDLYAPVSFSAERRVQRRSDFSLSDKEINFYIAADFQTVRKQFE